MLLVFSICFVYYFVIFSHWRHELVLFWSHQSDCYPTLNSLSIHFKYMHIELYSPLTYHSRRPRRYTQWLLANKKKTKLNAHTHDTRRFHWQYQKKTICSGTCCYLLHLLAIQCIICITTYNAWSIYKRVFVVSMLYALWTRCNTTARSNDRNNDESISVSQVWPPIHNWFWRNSKVSSLK